MHIWIYVCKRSTVSLQWTLMRKIFVDIELYFFFLAVLCLYKTLPSTRELNVYDNVHPHFGVVGEGYHTQFAATDKLDIHKNTYEYKDLQEAQKRIKELEAKLRKLEARIPQKYPDVKFLNYRSRKRILVIFLYMSYFNYLGALDCETLIWEREILNDTILYVLSFNNFFLHKYHACMSRVLNWHW